MSQDERKQHRSRSASRRRRRGRGEGGDNGWRGREQGGDKDKARQVVLMICDSLVKDGRSGQVRVSSLLNSPEFKVNNFDQLYSFLLKFPEVFELTKIQDSTTKRMNWYVRPKTSVTLCPRHTTAGGSCAGICGQIHICRFFMKGDGICKFGSECHHGHDFKTSHNFLILSENLLDKLTPAHMRVALKMNQDRDEATAEISSSRPKLTTCKFYNSGSSGCTQQGSCPYLHVCVHFITGRCKFETKCKRSHIIGDIHKLKKHGIDADHMSQDQLLLAVRDNLGGVAMATLITRPQSVSALHQPQTYSRMSGADISSSRLKLTTCKFYNSGSPGCTQQRSCPYLHVCVHFITGRCKFGYTCKRSHTISEKQKLKKHGIDADHMSQDQLLLAVRDNLGSVAMVTPMSRPQSIGLAAFHQLLTYPSMSGAKSSSSLLFPHFPGGARPKQPQYRNNPENNCLTLSRIMPKPTDSPQEDEDHSLERRMSSVGLSESRATVDVSLPYYWKHGLTYEKEFEKVPVDDESFEYKEIEDVVTRNLVSSNDKNRKVIGIHRIQNPERYDIFNRKRSWMLKKNQCPQSSLERRLFHGTKQHCMDAICKQGFDFRLSGMSTGTKFGKGTYFSTRAKYSLCYTDCNKIFVCKVLVGDYALGKPELLRPPHKDTYNLYDSCVDNVKTPDMFVVFDLDQAYPEYVVTLTDKVAY